VELARSERTRAPHGRVQFRSIRSAQRDVEMARSERSEGNGDPSLTNKVSQVNVPVLEIRAQVGGVVGFCVEEVLLARVGGGQVGVEVR
jgi:hypothetical protein